MSTSFGYALFSDDDDEIFIGTAIKGLRRNCSNVFHDYQSDGTYQNAFNLAAHIITYKIDTLWLIAPDRVPTETLFFNLTEEFLADSFPLVLDRLRDEFGYEGYIPLCLRDEQDGDSKDLVEAQRTLRNNLRSLFSAYSANLPQTIEFAKLAGNLSVHYLYPADPKESEQLISKS